MKILILNGANLNLLGTREPDIYGSTSMDDILTHLKSEYSQHAIEYFQSNFEGEIIGAGPIFDEFLGTLQAKWFVD